MTKVEVFDTSGTSCLGPLAGLEKQRFQYKAAVGTLADAATTTLVLDSRPQRAALAEAARTSAELPGLNIVNQRRIVNGLMPTARNGDPLAAAIARRDRGALASLPAALKLLPTDRVPLQPHNMVGVAALRSMLNGGGMTSPTSADTKLLLDATGTYHRDIMRHAPEAGRLITPMMRLHDPAQTKMLLVTLPESTPVLEAAALQEDLRRAGIEPWAWVINASLASAGPTDPLLAARARAELDQVVKVQRGLATRTALVPGLPEEPVGPKNLAKLATAQT